MLPNPIRKGAPSRGAIALALILLSRSGAASEVVVFAAATLTGALEEIVPRAQFAGVSLSFASSSSLARQIEAGAPADLYFSASSRWMDYLEAKNLIEPATRVDILTNSLILITPPGAAFAVHLRPDFDFAAAFSGRLALADPDHVPAGVYARQALEALGWWPRLGRRLAPAPHVLAALVYVERGECPVGIVYATDADCERVDIVAALPDSLHQPIVYPLAALRGHASPAVRRLRTHLLKAESRAVFRKHGFGLIGGEQ